MTRATRLRILGCGACPLASVEHGCQYPTAPPARAVADRLLSPAARATAPAWCPLRAAPLTLRLARGTPER